MSLSGQLIDPWIDPELGLSSRQTVRAPGFREWLRSSGLPIGAALADPVAASTELKCSSRGMAQLERAIVEESRSFSAAQVDYQILSKLVVRLRQCNRPLPQPRALLLFSLPRSPFAGEVPGREGIVFARRCVEMWVAAEDKWIRRWRDSTINDRRDARRGSAPPPELVIFSGILHGGLLHTSSVAAIARAFLDPDKTTGLIGDQVHMHCDLPWQGRPHMEFRCWAPDVQTACLIHPLSRLQATFDMHDPDGKICKILFAAIVREMRDQGVAAVSRPKSIQHLIDLVALCARTEMPGVLVDYACRSFVSHSLKPQVMRRIFWQERIEDDQTDEPQEGEQGRYRPEPANCRQVPEDPEPNGLRNLRRALSGRTATAVIDSLRQLIRGALNQAHTAVFASDVWQYTPPDNRKATSRDEVTEDEIHTLIDGMSVTQLHRECSWPEEAIPKEKVFIVDVSAPISVLNAQFLASIERAAKQKVTMGVNFSDFADFGLLPYIDLRNWQRLIYGGKVTRSAQASLIFPRTVRGNGDAKRITETTKPLAEKMLDVNSPSFSKLASEAAEQLAQILDYIRDSGDPGVPAEESPSAESGQRGNKRTHSVHAPEIAAEACERWLPRTFPFNLPDLKRMTIMFPERAAELEKMIDQIQPELNLGLIARIRKSADPAEKGSAVLRVRRDLINGRQDHAATNSAETERGSVATRPDLRFVRRDLSDSLTNNASSSLCAPVYPDDETACWDNPSAATSSETEEEECLPSDDLPF